MIIFALDPGGTTGWAKCVLEEEADSIDEQGNLRTKRVGHFSSDQIGPGSHHMRLWEILGELVGQTQELHLVVESFQYRQSDANRTGTVLVSLEYIGIAKLFALLHPERVRYQEQTPAEGKGFVTDTKIRRLGLWTPGMPHAMDAMRHLIYYQVVRLKDYSYIDKWK